MPLLQCGIAEPAVVRTALMTHLKEQGDCPLRRNITMAYASSHAAPLSIRAQAERLFARIAAVFNVYLDLRARTAEIQSLLELNDHELAARGLTRDGIVQHVFRDRLGV
jgi:uncharacterized protein YjiS (DUF1127 family)